MASYNRVILVGNLTREIELKYTPGGTAVMDNAVAVNDRRKAASGEWIEETTFVDVTFWGRTAEVASEYLGKGSPVLVEGRLKMDQWETDGQKRSKLRVICERMQMLSSGAPTTGGNSGGRSPARASGDDEYGSFDSEPSKSNSQASAGSRPAKNNPTNDSVNAGQREAQPTGNGPGYDDPDIPF